MRLLFCLALVVGVCWMLLAAHAEFQSPNTNPTPLPHLNLMRNPSTGGMPGAQDDPKPELRN